MATDPQKEKSGLEHTAQAAGAVKGAIKAGKALAGASKGAAFGPYGMAAGLAWEGRKVIAKAAMYADGFLRGYKNGGTVVANGKAVRLLGRVCMDQCMVDVTDVDIAAGDYVYIFDACGENMRRLCDAAGTIPYEAICLVSKRVKRVAI